MVKIEVTYLTNTRIIWLWAFAHISWYADLVLKLYKGNMFNMLGSLTGTKSFD